MPADLSTPALELFAERFGGPAEFVVRSPGRVNLIGDHTDYNEGFVLPMAIDRHVWLAGRPRADGRVRLVSRGFADVAFDLVSLARVGVAWGEYAAGVAWSLMDDGWQLAGWEGAVVSDIPSGAGLSSSAALELAVARSFAHVSGRTWDPIAGAHAAQRAENDWVGMACGIMDQLVVATARPDAALFIDCRTLATSPVPIPNGIIVLVVDSGSRRSLVESSYNERRASCEEAAARLGVAALRDVDATAVEEAGLPGMLRRRALHVVTENQRVLGMRDALPAGDAKEAGRLMAASHGSMRDDYEVSTPAIDRLVAGLGTIGGVLGARITGAGFGGCVVALIEANRKDQVTAAISALGPSAHVVAYPTRPVHGTSLQEI